jgi:hypothetical protein
MRGRFEKDDIVVLAPNVRMPFKVPSRKGVVRFAYDHEPPAYDVEFFWQGRSLGKHYLTDDELKPFLLRHNSN